MNRREFARGGAALSAVTLASAVVASQTMHAPAERPGGSAQQRRRPNIVYVLCDDLGIGDISCYNPNSRVPMPNADRLAAEGMRFTDMHSSSAVCTPSRYSILTGRYCWRSRLKKGVLQGDSPNLIEEGRLTVPGLLKQQGYYTAGVGKWHLGLGEDQHTDYSKPLRPGPLDHGFDYYYGIPSSLDYPPFVYFENDYVVEAPTADTPGSRSPRGVFWRAGKMAPGFRFDQCLPQLTDKAVAVIQERGQHREQPFFLYVALPSPHTPWVPLPQYKGKSGAGTYGEYVMETDDMVGRLMAAVRDAGMEQDTLFILTSDNGSDWKPEDIDRWGHRANDTWRGEKADIWEAGHRIPFLVRWPGVVSRGSVSNQRLSLTDFMATAAAIVRAPLPTTAGEDSFNLLPVLEGHQAAPVRSSLIDHSIDGMFCITAGEWKLEEGLGSGGFSAPRTVELGEGGPKGQLYNLRLDPREENNLYSQRPDIVAHLHELLQAAKDSGHTRAL